jgi:chromosome segregation ATPase
VLCLLALAAPLARGAEQSMTATANPIRKVVKMLQAIEKKVVEEGEKEEKAFKEFMCYCKTGVQTLEQSIEDAKAKIDALGEQLKGAMEKKELLEKALAEHKDSRAEAKKQVAEATALREKEHKDYMQLKADYETNISAAKAAVAAIEKGMGSSFIQTTAAKTVASYVMERANMADINRKTVLAFLSGSEADLEVYAPKSGQIVGILKQMVDDMVVTLEEATKKEEEAKANFDEMVEAKTKEINTLTAQIEEEMLRMGELEVLLAGGANDLEETKETMAEDQKYLAELKKGCKTKEAEWEDRCKLRNEELVAITETIKILNNDDALELFKKTLPAPAEKASSLLQIQMTQEATRSAALAVLKKGRHSAKTDLVMLAIQGKKIGFEKVIKLIDEMLVTLKKEQEDDDNKKSYCDAELDKTEDEKKELERSIQVSETAIEDLKGAIAQWTTEIAALKSGIRALDKSVAEATKLRQEENAEYKQLMEDNKAAKEILLFAKNRLNKFYNPKLYKPEMDQKAAAAAEGAAFVQVRMHSQSDSDEAPPPPPETFGAYTKSHQENSGVIASIDKLVLELDTEMTEAETEEKDAQADYETLMTDAADKRAADSKALTDKEAEKAKGEEALQLEADKKKDLNEELMETMKVLMDLHSECDWLLKYFDVRKAARAEEVDSLGKAKDVLNGADYSLLQTSRHTRLA